MEMWGYRAFWNPWSLWLEVSRKVCVVWLVGGV